ncbi:hypothetical protein [Peptostreptococcus equinus]|uniref:DUF5808 domain-containing protein n=1 Tax=Peptostreptococcus equinus TaxID=3003601 RepID=A0ABY7JV03_9FIRM|nr:hypothetical protein [Peptostreptococcus sp. CBA3647]WAW15547.1 hypothetical protein O0R46_03640 [Peptostreptococcus sp. CBA3647]
MGNFIMLISAIIMIPMIFYFLFNETKFKKNIAIGVTIPSSEHENKEVVALLNSFKSIIIFLAIFFTITIFGILVIDSAYLILYFMIWILLLIIIPYIFYYKYNIKLKSIKIKNGWKFNKKDIIIRDIKSIQDYNYLSMYVFLPAIILPFIFLFLDKDFMIGYLTFGVLSFIYALSYKYLYRNKAEMVNDNTKLTFVLTQIRKYNWAKIWVINAYANILLAFSTYLFTKNINVGILIFILTIIVILISCVIIEFKVRQMQEILTRGIADNFYIDEDDYWIGGLFYYNKNDSKLIVNNRVGINSSINMAKPAGKIISFITLIIILSMPIIGIETAIDSKSPIEINVTKNELTVNRYHDSYNLKLKDIEKIKLIKDIDNEKMSKIVGYGDDNVYSGTFRDSKEGEVEVCLDPNVGPHILVQTKDKKKYIFASRDKNKNKEIFTRLNFKINRASCK